jgi:hypothetical protein
MLLPTYIQRQPNATSAGWTNLLRAATLVESDVILGVHIELVCVFYCCSGKNLSPVI